PGQAARRRFGANPHRRRDGHAELYGPGTSGGPDSRCRAVDRRLVARRDSLRSADGAAAVSGRDIALVAALGASQRCAAAGVQEREWPDDRLALLEAQLAELATLHPAVAEKLQGELIPRYTQMLRESFAFRNRPILQAEDLPAFEVRFAALAQRDAELGQTV